MLYTKELGRLQSMGSQWVRYDSATNMFTFLFTSESIQWVFFQKFSLWIVLLYHLFKYFYFFLIYVIFLTVLGLFAAEDLSFSHGDWGLLSIVTCTGFLHWFPLLWTTGLCFIKPSVHRKPTPCQSPADGREDPVGIPGKDKAAHHFRKYLWNDFLPLRRQPWDVREFIGQPVNSVNTAGQYCSPLTLSWQRTHLEMGGGWS